MTIALYLNSTAEMARYVAVYAKEAKSGLEIQEERVAKGYKLQGKMDFQGLPISIENKKGSYRHWHDPLKNENGKTLMRADYGYIRSTKTGDGEGMDVYVGPNKKSKKVFVVDQQNPKNGKYDEQKVMLGYDSAKEAKAAYLQHYDDPAFFGGMAQWRIDDFQDHVQRKKKLKYLSPEDRVAKAQAHHPARYQNPIFAVMDRRSYGKKQYRGKKAPRSEFADPYNEPGDLAFVPKRPVTLPGPKKARKQPAKNRWIVRHSPNTMMGTTSSWG